MGIELTGVCGLLGKMIISCGGELRIRVSDRVCGLLGKIFIRGKNWGFELTRLCGFPGKFSSVVGGTKD